MRNEIIIKPLVGIEWAQGNILLGQQKKQLDISHLLPETVRQSLYLLGADIRVDFDGTDAVEFVEVRGGCGSLLCPVFDRMPLFEMEVTEVLKALREKYVVKERENGHMYVLTEWDIALWRERTEADVEGFVADMKADGVAAEGNPDVEAEWKLAKHFQVVSIGKKGYFAG